jgi:cell division protein FtsL
MLMAYTRGNLAMKPKPIERVSPGYREQTTVVTKQTLVPIKEKLLYLLTIIICVAISSFVIWQYANIYDLNKQGQRMNDAIFSNQTKISQLEVQRQTLKSVIVTTAIEEGYVLPEEQSVIHVPRVSSLTQK